MQDMSQRPEIKTDAGFGPKVTRSRWQTLRVEAPNFIKKNKGLAVNPAFLKMLPRLAAHRVRHPAPALGQTRLFVATHHKVMTTYFSAVLKLLSLGTGLAYGKVHSEVPKKDTQLILSMHGKLDLDTLAPYRGIHIMRDPRDMIVSSYHYHKWTNELWVHRPDENGRTYQEKLNAADTADGLFMEINHFIFFYRATLEAWDMDNPDILEVAYEDLMGETRDALYDAMFAHLGLKGADLALATDLMRLFEAGSRTGRKAGEVEAKSHVRSGKSGQWKKELAQEHVDYIEQELGDVLRKFGY